MKLLSSKTLNQLRQHFKKQVFANFIEVFDKISQNVKYNEKKFKKF